jgi:hypothetical protein
MSDNNKEKIMDEKLEDVTGGRGFGLASQFSSQFSSHHRKHEAEVEKLSQEALKRLNPKDPSSWFQTVADLFNERGGIK